MLGGESLPLLCFFFALLAIYRTNLKSGAILLSLIVLIRLEEIFQHKN